jgi:hypothetical protein
VAECAPGEALGVRALPAAGPAGEAVYSTTFRVVSVDPVFDAREPVMCWVIGWFGEDVGYANVMATAQRMAVSWGLGGDDEKACRAPLSMAGVLM